MCYCNFTFPLHNCHFIFFIVLFYFVLLFNMHVFIVLIFPACTWLAPLAADVYINKICQTANKRVLCVRVGVESRCEMNGDRFTELLREPCR